MAKKTIIPEGDAGYDIRVTQVVVVDSVEPIFSDRAITVEINDVAAGEFVRIMSDMDGSKHSVAIDVVEWPTVRRAIDFMVGQCRKDS